MPTRPLLPKHMAHTIRLAQAKVIRARDDIVHAEKRIIEEREEIALFSANPRAWVDEVYGPDMAIDDYPPVTRMKKIRDHHADRIERRHVRAVQLKIAISELAELESSTLQRIQNLKQSKTHVPWPKPLKPFNGYENVLDTGAEAVEKATAIGEQDRKRTHEYLLSEADDGAKPGDGSLDAMNTRRRTIFWRSSKSTASITLATREAFQVTAWDYDNISQMQQIIDHDREGGTFGNLWNIACGLVLTGCDWSGFSDWRNTRIKLVSHLIDEPVLQEKGLSIAAIKEFEKQRCENINNTLIKVFIPDCSPILERLVIGSDAKPSQLYRFWQEHGFTEKIARNWFLKSQDFTQVFSSEEYLFGRETFKAMRNAGLVYESGELPIDQALSELKLENLQTAMQYLGVKPLRLITECRAALLSFPDPDAVKSALIPHGYNTLKGIKPPPWLTWDDFQSWRTQIRVMAGMIIDLQREVVPSEDRKLLLR